MDVIALISGGKDSFFSILHCIKNGHRIVALANLHPPEVDPQAPRIATYLPSHDVNTPIPSILSNVEKDELDSFMYQTVGHNLLPYYATALNIPLYRTPVIGSAINQNLAYKLENKDETEDLYRLLKYVQQKHPSASGVSSGAILSTYQRTRVENVCMRLGLTSLAYLWHRPQHLLLDDMASVKLDARIVKVAALGFDPDSFLWQNVTSPQVRRKLRVLKDRWGVHIAGEGGEYETIVVEGPGWRIRIVVNNENGDAYQVVLGGGESGVGHLKILKATGEKIGNGAGTDQVDWVKDLRKPQPLNYYFRKILDGLRGGEFGGRKEQLQHSGGQVLPPSGSNQVQIFITSHITGDTIVVNNLSAPSSRQEMEDIMSRLTNHLARYHTNPNSEAELEARSAWFSKITQITLLLRSMDNFHSVNTIYNRYFRDPNPPSRVCIAIGDAMPPGCNIMMHVQAVSGERKGLHIQGRSYWAPANIGPYSQAISTQGLVYISGQIPLSPATMQLPTVVGALGESITAPLEFQTVLAMQHMWRVARATKVSGYALVLGFTTTYKGMKVMSRAWREHVSPGFSEGDHDQGEKDCMPNPRLWGYGQDEDVIDQTPYEGEEYEYVPIEDEATLPMTSFNIPSLLICQVPELPRGAPVEWVALGIDEEYIPRRCHNNTDSEDSDEESRYAPCTWTVEDESVSEDIQYHVRTWYNKQVSYGSVLQLGTNDTKVATILFKFLNSGHKGGLLPCVATAYLAMESEGEIMGDFCLEWESLCRQSHLKNLLQIVPVQRVWFREEEFRVGVVIRYLRP